MPATEDSRFLRTCIQCGNQASLKKKPEASRSGLCNACAQHHPLEVTPGSPYAMSVLAQFWSHVDKETSIAGCWLWIGCVDHGGYGKFTFRMLDGAYKTIGAHRFAYQAEHGILPSSVFVLHKPPCVIPRCVRHLYAGTHQQNVQDAVLWQRFASGDRHRSRTHPETLARGDKHGLRLHPEAIARGDSSSARLHPESVPYGENHANAKLSTQQIKDIRNIWASGCITQSELAEIYHIHQVYVWKIVTGRTRRRG